MKMYIEIRPSETMDGTYSEAEIPDGLIESCPDEDQADLIVGELRPHIEAMFQLRKTRTTAFPVIDGPAEP